MAARGARYAAAAAVALLPVAAWASGEEGQSPGTLLWQAVNLVILAAVLVHFARKPVQDFFRGRREQVKSDLDSAAGVLADAEQRLVEWQARADRLEAEIAEIKAMARKRAEAEREHILADAEASASRIRADALAAVDQEVARARAELRAEAAELATRLAADLLRQHVSEADQRRLVDEFVARVESSGADGRAA
jgi:F-type H+-transporting ATPase subunit b